MKTNKKYGVMAGVNLALFLILIIALKTVDVAVVGPEDTSVGFSHINVFFHNITGVQMIWYNITKAFGALALLVCVCFGGLGVYQLITRKSVARVDRVILLLGGLYVVTIAIYALFEKVIINYRPVIEEGAEHVEASFPSSHTMLILVVMCSTVMVIEKYAGNGVIFKIVSAACIVVAVLTVCGRAFCGVHWITDIIGGCLISAALLNAFAYLLEKNDK